MRRPYEDATALVSETVSCHTLACAILSLWEVFKGLHQMSIKPLLWSGVSSGQLHPVVTHTVTFDIPK